MSKQMHLVLLKVFINTTERRARDIDTIGANVCLQKLFDMKF